MTKETSSCDPTNRRVKGELTTISETINLTMDNLRSVRPTLENLRSVHNGNGHGILWMESEMWTESK